MNIPQTVNHDGTDYDVTAIGDRAFREKGLTGVTFSTPSNVTSIGRWAFTLNKLRSVTIPNSVTSIRLSAFTINRLTRVVFKGTDPPSLGSGGDIADSFGGFYDAIAVVVPDGTLNDYETAWNTSDFKSIREEGDITIETFIVGGIEYEYQVTTTAGSPSTGSVIVIGIDPQNAATSINIPENVTYQGTDFEITGIDGYAFMENNLTSVTIGQNVTSIGHSAFWGNNLNSVIIPNSVTRIERGAFLDNDLTSVDIPNSVTSIGAQAFRQNALTSVTISENVKSIDSYTFFDNNLNSLTIPNRVTSIGTSAFANNALTSVTIPNSVTSIGGGAFLGNDLTEVTIPEGLTDLPGGIFEDNALTSVTIPNSVTRIGYAAFEKNALTSVTIPGNVTNIQQWAFAYNPNLALVTVEATHPPSLHAEAFQGRDLGTIDVVVPWGKRQVYLDNGWTGFNNITEAAANTGDTFTADHITYEVTSIAPNSNTFKAIGYNTAGGPTVNIPQTVNHGGIDYAVTAIGNEAFKEKQLTGVTFSTPGNVTSIGSQAFRKNALKNVTIPNSVTSIGIEAFQDNDLASVTLPNNNLTSIANGTFQNNDLTSVDIPGSVTSIGTEAFRNNKFTSVTIPENVTSMGPFAFANNPTIHTVVAQGVATVPIIVTANTFSNRHEVHVLVPGGKRQDYLDNGWTGFSSITEEPETNSTFTADNITYEITSITPNTVKVTGYTTTGGTATIPPTVDHGPNTYTVTRIETRAFDGSELERVTISENVTSIGPFAFANNPIHTVVAQGAAIVPIIVTANTFSDRGKIHVFVPKGSPAGSIESAYKAAGWRDFASITEALVIGDTFIVDQVTYEITAISPNTVTAIGYNTTGGAVTIPKAVNHDGTDYDVTAIGEEAFRKKELTGVAFSTPSNVTSIGSKAFLNNELANVTIPNSVTSIGIAAFNNNDLTSVEIPNSVTRIPLSAFAWNDLTSVNIPDNVTSIGGGAFAWNNLTSVEIPDNVTSIGGGAFRSNDLTDVTIPNSVTRIGDGAFRHNDLTSVDIPNSVTSIGRDAFRNNDLTSVEIPNSVTAIEWGAFAYNQLTSVDIPDSVTSIGSEAFLNNDLTSVTIPNSVTRIGRSAFRNNALTSVEIPNSVTSIGTGAFAHNKLSSVTIPNSVETIGDNAFGSNELSSLEIHNGVTSIGDGAFKNNALTSVTLPNSVTRIEDSAFSNNELTSVTLPNSVEIIDNWTFASNELTEVTIPGSVTSIRVKAFYENPGLGLVRVKANDPPGLHAEAFENADRGQIDLIVPTGKEQAYLDKGWTNFASITEGIPVSISASTQLDNLASFPVTIAFGENVTGFTSEDIDVVNATVVDGSFSPVDGSASTYAIELTPMTPTSCESTITIDIPANAATGVNSSSNLPGRATVTVSDPPVIPGLSTTVSTVCAGEDVIFTITGAEGDRVTYDDGTSTRTVTIPAGGTTMVPVNRISANTTLTLTEVTRGNCNVAIPSTNTTTATVTVNAIPSASAFTVSSNAAVLCAGDDAIFTITGTAGDRVTYEDGTSARTVTIPAGGTATVPVNRVSANTTLTLTQVTRGNCNVAITKTNTTTATVTVNAIPSASAFTVSSNAAVLCAGDDAIFTITGTEGDRVTYEVRTSTRTVTIPADGKTTVTINKVSTNATLRLIQASNGNCNISLSKMATVTVKATPSAPSVNSLSVEYCQGDEATALTATGDNLLWYTSPTDQMGDADAPTPNTATAGTTFHYVTQTTNGCESERVKIEVTVEVCPAQIGDVFTASGMDYEITSVTPNKVKVIDYIGSATEVEIPETVDHKDETYTVTAIGSNAFREKQLTGVTIPGGVTSIGTSAFRSNELTEVTIPNDVTSIGASAFRNNELTEVTLPDGVTSIGASAFVGNTGLDLVTVEATHPPSLHENAFADRSQVNLVVPVGMRQTYLDNGWDGFRWIAEEGQVITAVSNDELNDLTLYPNPARDQVYIDLGPGQVLKQVNIYTMTGAHLYSENGLEINTGRLSEGMYLFEIVTKTGARSMRKVIIQ